MDRLAQLAQAASRAGLAVPLLILELALALAIVSLLVPILFVRRPEPFDRLIVLLELVLGRSVRRTQQPIERARSEPPGAG